MLRLPYGDNGVAFYRLATAGLQLRGLALMGGRRHSLPNHVITYFYLGLYRGKA